MKDLRVQLAAAFGRPLPAEAPAAPAAPPGPLDPEAHLADPWLEALRPHCRALGLDLGARPVLGHARQLTDQAVKKLKDAGRGRDAAALAELRDHFFDRRDKAGWAAVKEAFAADGLPEKTYRALKQEGACPHQTLVRLARIPAAERAGMGHARLRERLLAT